MGFFMLFISYGKRAAYSETKYKEKNTAERA